MYDYSTYLSPFTWRYASAAMREVWSEEHKRRLWRQIWVALAGAEAEFGVLDPAQVEDLKAHAGEVDVRRALEIEAGIHHDLMAELRAFAEQCPVGGGALHLGATSADIEDNADALRIRQSLDLVLDALGELLRVLAGVIAVWADTPVMAFTHLQPAEPSTLGYRLAQYGQDLLADWENLDRTRAQIKGKGFKGAVGTAASFAELVGADQVEAFEARLSALLDVPFYPLSTQIYPRKQDYQVIGALAGLGASLYKLAFDVRLLQSPGIGEVAEPFGSAQVGSSAMPFKRNPINAEKIDSLARALAQAPRLAWDNAAHSLLERTLDDSANRRTLLPEAFLAADELLGTAARMLEGLWVDEEGLRRNLAAYAPFAATERVLVALGKAGADRQEMHERLRQHTITARRALKQGQPNPLVDLVCQDAEFGKYLEPEQMRALMEAGSYVGLAPQWASRLAREIKNRFPGEK